MSGPLIRAETGEAFTALATRLTVRAAALAAAHAGTLALEARGDAPSIERRWRRAGLLWPLFGKG